MKLSLKHIAASLVAAGFVGTAIAADNADIKVRASVVDNCKVSATQDINFGALDPAQATDSNAQGAVTFACTKNVSYTMTADNGSHYDSTSSKRRMKGADQNFLPYALAQSSFTGSGQGFSTPITVAIAASVAGVDYKDLPADNYLDTLRVTLLP